MRILVWQWGRRGAGPRFAASLADGLRMIPGTEVLLSLSTGAEILQGRTPPPCGLPVATYASAAGLLCRAAQGPWIARRLATHIANFRPDVAICAMPAPLDLVMADVLRQSGVPAAVVVHDADTHPGDGVPLQMFLQRQLMRHARLVVALSRHVATRLAEQRSVRAGKLVALSHPPFVFGHVPVLPPRAHAGPPRLLCFGRLLRYKGLDLLAAAMRQLGARHACELRVVGHGPESDELAALRALPGVTVENRWLPEDEIGELLAWSDIVVLSYREASQSGIAPAAIAAGRMVVSTRVGGLDEQLRDEPLARLCEPTAESIGAALRDLIDAPPDRLPAPAQVDPRLAWRDMTQRLLGSIAL